ncbi:MAG: gliding motility-associated C-terminal domain-containing protein, partial [Chitinophagaceae bacterium]
MPVKQGIFLLIAFVIFDLTGLFAQPCTTLGQTPSTAFPVCGTTVFQQDNVPLCNTNDLFVPGCSGGNTTYANKNPFWYRFKCYTSGSLGFTITPTDMTDDYDWQLYDITGLNPEDVLTNQNIIISGNWSGSSGATGASSSGVNFIQCASDPTQEQKPTFAKMPDIIVGHEYILLVSHYTPTQSGYSLSFTGGTAVITDPTEPHLQKATTSCDGSKIIVKLNKKMKCSSLTAKGSEFSLLPVVTTITGAVAKNCSASFDFDEIELTLAAPLSSNDYQLIINKGTDGNSLLDNCERGIPDAETAAFSYIIPQPVPIDSVGKIGCAPNTIRLFFKKKIDCSSIASDGSNFRVSGPGLVNVVSAIGESCTDGLSDIITLRLAEPIYNAGLFTVTPQLAVNGGAVRDECGKIIQPAPISFNTADTVTADFTYANKMGCRQDTLSFTHHGGNGITTWDWRLNNTNASGASHSIIWPATSTNSVTLTVSNGTCIDSVTSTIVLDNEVKANFTMQDILCPEDPLIVENLSTGLVDNWKWNYGLLRTIQQHHPDPFYFPASNTENDHLVKLVATNTTFGCSDSISKKVKVLKSCFIAVPSAFTPNNDGLNDFLYPTNALKADNLTFKVYNRWGQLVFSSRNWQDKW